MHSIHILITKDKYKPIKIARLLQSDPFKKLIHRFGEFIVKRLKILNSKLDHHKFSHFLFGGR